jgi:GT2 family glycosyltransferase
MHKSTTHQPRPAIIIPNWNGADLLRPCIDSLLSQSLPCLVIVVENGSTDESDEILASYGKNIVVLKQEKNLGFAGGVNVGIRYALDKGIEYIGLFNNDAVAEEGWLEGLVGALAKNPSCGIAASKVLLADRKTIDAIGTCYSIFGAPFQRGHNEIDAGQYDTETIVFGGYGCGSLYRAAVFAAVGLFDEDFFAYYEEDDINFRAQLQGFGATTSPQAVIYHDSGHTSNKLGSFATYHRTKNFWPLYIKNMPGWLLYKYLPLTITWFCLMGVKRIGEGNLLPFLKATVWSLFMTPHTLHKRRVIQRSRTVSIARVDKLLHHGLPVRTARSPR